MVLATPHFHSWLSNVPSVGLRPVEAIQVNIASQSFVIWSSINMQNSYEDTTVVEECPPPPQYYRLFDNADMFPLEKPSIPSIHWTDNTIFNNMYPPHQEIDPLTVKDSLKQ